MYSTLGYPVSAVRDAEALMLVKMFQNGKVLRFSLRKCVIYCIESDEQTSTLWVVVMLIH